jgi:LPS-assembly lipoprotein
MRRMIASCLLAALISSCGFQLRESARLPEGVDAIVVQSADPLSALAVELQRTLKANAASGKADATSARLEIISESLTREILSVNDRARVSEFVLVGKARARLLQATGKPGADGVIAEVEIIPAFDVSVRREYSFDEAQALGAAQEEEIISAEMKRELAELIVLKLQR